LIVLDTHAFLWFASAPDRLGREATRAIRRAPRLGVCAITCFEFATLVARGRVTVDRSPLDWLEHALGLPHVELLSLTPAVGVRASQLVALEDPADRIIVATALLESAPLVTHDERIRDSGLLPTIW